MSQAQPRKLAVLLHADVEGSTSLVQKNESIAHERIQTAFNRLSDTIQQYGGIAQETRGDALVAEFARASDAVCAALMSQRDITAHNLTLADDIRPQLRVGISIGEVVVADGTITGAGVVLAQRLEQLADASGVVVQAAVAETVPARFPFEFIDLGEQTLKGFERPVRAFVARQRPDTSVPNPERGHAPPPASREYSKPHIIVLPFVDMSRDADQEYFADGVAEEIITGLSRIPWLSVVARNTSFSYKNKSVDVQRLGAELEVGYVLEGSVRKQGNRVRVTAQLIDATADRHIWAENIDGELDEIFAFQDQIAGRVMTAVAPEITQAEITKTLRRRPDVPDAWDAYLRSLPEMRRLTEAGWAAAVKLLERAVTADPNFSVAHARLAGCHITAAYQGWIDDTSAAVSLASQHARIALEIDPMEPYAHDAQASIHQFSGEQALAAASAQAALNLYPTMPTALGTLINAFAFLGETERAIDTFQQAVKLNPRDRDRSSWYMGLANAHFAAADYASCARAAKQNLELKPNWFGGHLILAAALAQLGDRREAAAVARRLMELVPNFSLCRFRKQCRFVEEETVSRLITGLELAGVK